MADVVMYRTRWCGFCIRADRLLRKKGIDYTVVDVSRDPEKRAWLRAITGRRTVPQIFIDDEAIGGCRELYALERRGLLDALLAEP